ncbi:hypothetical protein [Caulobacter sp. S45]|uniref:hypothetical protein n=1 Tax=Caulobacter sp. S45 TaxID=1641861 RepID=UPI0015771415|nr:hypothetical protein [Caulobacter sp. S45]
MPQSRLTDARSTTRLLPTALVVWVLVAGYLLLREHLSVDRGFGDSDDATRMTMVRDLLHGRGWYDQRLTRFQPPYGVYMHWSRLLDGALAMVERTFALGFGEARAELLTRLLWPLALIGPAVAAGLCITRRLAGDPPIQRVAMLAAAAGCVASLPLYAQFHPGRIDHHNVQLLLWLTAYAGAASRGPGIGGAVAAGAAMGVGLAIGLEALPFYAVIGGFMASRFILRAEEATRLGAFGLALFGSTAAAFLVQTPPARWGAPACDALAINLAAAVCVASAGLAAASATHGMRLTARLGAMGIVALLAALTYVGLDPQCLHGPFAEVDGRIRPIWLSGVQEMTPLPVLLQKDLPTGLTVAVAMVASALAWAAVGLSAARRRSPTFWLAGLMLGLAIASSWAMLRMSSYLFWSALAPIATATAMLVMGRSPGRQADPVRVVAVGLALTPAVLASLMLFCLRIWTPAHASPAAPASTLVQPGADRCFEAGSYDQLARLAPGTVLAEPDLGPFVVAHTSSSAVSAPYHRMAFGLLAGHAALAAPASGGAAAMTRALHVRYVLECRAHAAAGDRIRAAGSLQAALDAGRPPDWLERLSPSAAPLQVYRVRPSLTTSGPSRQIGE